MLIFSNSTEGLKHDTDFKVSRKWNITMIEKNKLNIWPEPRELKFGTGTLSLQNPHLSLQSQSEKPAINAELEKIFNLFLGESPRFSRSENGVETVVVDMKSIANHGIDAETVLEPEGYILDIQNDKIILSGNDPQGLFYAFQTLMQLLEQAEEELPEVTIRDWPAKRLRGAHMFLPSRQNIGFMLDFIYFLARYKYNTLFIEVGAAMEFERHPEINSAWQKLAKEAMVYTSEMDPDPESCDPDRWEVKVMPKGPYAMMCSRKGYLKDSIHPGNGMGDVLTKDEVKLILSACAERHIEVVPEVQSLSHVYYLCMAHPDIAERAEDPWPDTYCPSNPKSYELLFDVMDEVIEVFNPKMIHIGHDEIYSMGLCPKCEKIPLWQLMANDVNKIYDYLAAANIKVAMWGDKLIPPDKLAKNRERTDSIKDYAYPYVSKAVDLIPKDILIIDWYWGYAGNTEAYFNEKGFQHIYGNFNAQNKYMKTAWKDRAFESNNIGGETSSWCEVSFLAFSYNGHLTNFLRDSNNYWFGEYREPEEIRTNFTELMTREYQRLNTSGNTRNFSECEITTLDISNAATNLPPELENKILLDPPNDLEVILNDKGFLSKALFISKRNPKGVTIPVNAKIKGFKILHASITDGIYHRPTSHSFHRGPAELLKYIVNYANGFSEKFASIYRQDTGLLHNTGPIDDCCHSIPVVAGKKHAFYLQTWISENEKNIVESITILPGADAGEMLIPAIGLSL